MLSDCLIQESLTRGSFCCAPSGTATTMLVQGGAGASRGRGLSGLTLLLLGSSLMTQSGAFIIPLRLPVRARAPLYSMAEAASAGDMAAAASAMAVDAAVQDHAAVQLRVYDISQGYAGLLSQVLRKDIQGIWHVGIGVFGKEYWFSTHVESKALSETETAFGMAPKAVYSLGRTELTEEEFEAYLDDVLADRYNIETYHVFERNCNNFADEATKYLLGKNVDMPSYILELSDTALEKLPAGQAALTRMITQQAARVVMMAWGHSNRSKEELAKKKAARAARLAEINKQKATQ